MAKEYSQTVFVRHESRKIVQLLTVVIMVDWISECSLCARAFDQVLLKKQMLLRLFLFGCSQ